MSNISVIKFILVFLLLAAPAAQAVTLDSEGRLFEHGPIVNTPYRDVAIPAVNLGGGANLAVSFDGGHTGARDADLEDNFIGSLSVVPVPAAFWLFGAALIGFIGFSRRTTV
jgi:hypothetical protein